MNPPSDANPLNDLVLDRLDAAEDLASEVQVLVLAALLDEVDAALDPSAPQPQRPSRARESTVKPQRAWLRSISIEGFRGIGPAVELELTAGPGLTIIAGRNGSGKSSFAEGLELLLTGTSRRWENRKPKTWQNDWQNLHHTPTKIEAGLAIDGVAGAPRVHGSWTEGSSYADRAKDRITGADGLDSLADLGWNEPLATWRPFLSYNELAAILDQGPSYLYDALGLVLGLDPLSEAAKRLDDARKELNNEAKATKTNLDSLVQVLQTLDDPRATACLEAVAGRSWDLAALEATLEGADAASTSTQDLERLTRLAPFTTVELADTIHQLQDAADLLDATRDKDSDIAQRLADLLSQAKNWFDVTRPTPTDCPVCATPNVLDPAWHSSTQERISQLQRQAADLKSARQRVDATLRTARLLLDRPLGCDPLAAEAHGLDSASLQGAWNAWQRRPIDDPRLLAAHLEAHGPNLLTTAGDLRERATQLVAERRDTWRPIGQRIQAWLPSAHRQATAKDTMKHLKTAADWLGQVEGDLRNARFEPIKSEVRQIWELLRTQSNVALDDLRFAGTRTRRKVEMDLSVDGHDGVGFSVMSQGELNSLALSLFLPRATLDESPFRFLIIDDPVQAMDPSKVDGLAQVLHRAAETRQVIVLTHDDRLPEAVARLDIPATVLEVTRRENSVVEVRRIHDRLGNLLRDARSIAYDDKLPAGTRDRVIPGLCRQAIEHSAIEVTRRRRLDRGDSHLETEHTLAQTRSLYATLALALFDDESRSGDVKQHLDKQVKTFGHDAAEILHLCNKGTHEGAATGKDFITRVEKITRGLHP